MRHPGMMSHVKHSYRWINQTPLLWHSAAGERERERQKGQKPPLGNSHFHFFPLRPCSQLFIYTAPTDFLPSFETKGRSVHFRVHSLSPLRNGGVLFFALGVAGGLICLKWNKIRLEAHLVFVFYFKVYAPILFIALAYRVDADLAVRWKYIV